MKLETSFFTFCLLSFSLIASEAAHASGPRSTVLHRQSGLMECGRAYYKAHLTPVPQKSALAKLRVRVRYENKNAQAVCGGEVVTLKSVSEPRGAFPYKLPRFISPDSTNEARAGLIDRRSLTKGGLYRLACEGRPSLAQAIDLIEENVHMVSLRFKDAQAEARCGDGRYLKIASVLDHAEEVYSNK